MLFGFAEVAAGFFFFGKKCVELAEKFGAGMFAEDFVEPAWIWLLVFGGNNFDNIALFELGTEANHFAVYDGTGAGRADVAVEAVGKI